MYVSGVWLGSAKRCVGTMGNLEIYYFDSRLNCQIDVMIHTCELHFLHLNEAASARNQKRSQNAEKATHMKGRLPGQAVALFNFTPFQNGTFS